VDARFGLCGDSVNLDARLVMRIKWKLNLVCLKVVLFLTKDRCMVCVECTVGSEIALDAPKGTPR
jgi:hypothetical protein